MINYKYLSAYSLSLLGSSLLLASHQSLAELIVSNVEIEKVNDTYNVSGHAEWPSVSNPTGTAAWTNMDAAARIYPADTSAFGFTSASPVVTIPRYTGSSQHYTNAELYQKFTSQIGTSFNFTMTGLMISPSTICMKYNTETMGIAMLDCSGSIAPTVTCDFTMPNILLDHGELPVNEINGNSTQSELNISCTGDATISIGTSGTGLMNGTNQITSSLFIQGKQITSSNPIELTVGQSNSLIISSTLHTDGSAPEPGEKTGSYILTITVL